MGQMRAGVKVEQRPTSELGLNLPLVSWEKGTEKKMKTTIMVYIGLL